MKMELKQQYDKNIDRLKAIADILENPKGKKKIVFSEKLKKVAPAIASATIKAIINNG